MAKPTKNIEELLNNAKSYWVCPITGTKIDASDVQKIEAHKQSILLQEKTKEIHREQSRALATLAKTFSKIKDLKGLNDYMAAYLVFKNPSLQQKDIPIFSVENVELTNGITPFDRVAIKVNGLSPAIKTILKKDLRKDVDVNNPNEFFYVINKNENYLTKAIYEFQLETRKNKKQKVGMQEREVLDVHPTYHALAKRIKELNASLHEMKIEHAEVEKEMSKIRKEVLSDRTFHDTSMNAVSPSKSLKK